MNEDDLARITKLEHNVGRLESLLIKQMKATSDANVRDTVMFSILRDLTQKQGVSLERFINHYLDLLAYHTERAVLQVGDTNPALADCIDSRPSGAESIEHYPPPLFPEEES